MNRFHYLSISLTAFSLLAFRMSTPPPGVEASNGDTQNVRPLKMEPIGTVSSEALPSLPAGVVVTDADGNAVVWKVEE
ncbi:hypothetical protein [Lewinella sp. IMCC34183]|uniref:hypothetical protein n=1 Tax=Lewinella sp. IMCC34183 TaxID=2248762 RepID=UPI000E25FB68|nr:hypothetical protein [Lewinella sp. IMCC34183]